MIELWGRRNSSNVQKVLWALTELDLPFRRTPVGGGFGGGDDPAYRAMNPNGLVPVIRDGDLTLFESDAIVRYLARRYGGALALEDPEAARADQWACWNTTVYYPRIVPIFFGVIRTKRAEQDLTAWEDAGAALASAHAMLETRLAETPYVAGEHFTIGDIGLAISARRAGLLPVGAVRSSNVDAWLKRLSERPGWRWIDVQMGTCWEEWDAHEKALEAAA